MIATILGILELAWKVIAFLIGRKGCHDDTKKAIEAQDEIGRIAANPPSNHVADDRMRDGSF